MATTHQIITARAKCTTETTHQNIISQDRGGSGNDWASKIPRIGLLVTMAVWTCTPVAGFAALSPEYFRTDHHYLLTGKAQTYLIPKHAVKSIQMLFPLGSFPDLRRLSDQHSILPRHSIQFHLLTQESFCKFCLFLQAQSYLRTDFPSVYLRSRFNK